MDDRGFPQMRGRGGGRGGLMEEGLCHFSLYCFRGSEDRIICRFYAYRNGSCMQDLVGFMRFLISLNCLTSFFR